MCLQQDVCRCNMHNNNCQMAAALAVAAATTVVTFWQLPVHCQPYLPSTELYESTRIECQSIFLVHCLSFTLRAFVRIFFTLFRLPSRRCYFTLSAALAVAVVVSIISKLLLLLHFDFVPSIFSAVVLRANFCFIFVVWC